MYSTPGRGPTPLPGTDNADLPFFSPTGEWVGYFAQGSLLRILVAGGPPLPIAEGLSLPRGGTWLADNTIVFSNSGRLFRVPVTGGTPAPLGDADTATVQRWPQALPDGQRVLYATSSGTDAGRAGSIGGR